MDESFRRIKGGTFMEVKQAHKHAEMKIWEYYIILDDIILENILYTLPFSHNFSIYSCYKIN